jgi:hypothetical protein
MIDEGWQDIESDENYTFDVSAIHFAMSIFGYYVLQPLHFVMFVS